MLTLLHFFLFFSFFLTPVTDKSLKFEENMTVAFELKNNIENHSKVKYDRVVEFY